MEFQCGAVKEPDPKLTYPTNTFPLYHQVAGHRHGKGQTKLGLLLHSDGSVLKPLVENDVRSIREQGFYEKITEHAKNCTASFAEAQQCCDQVLHGIIGLTAQYLGEFQSDYVVPGMDGPPVKYIKIEDLVHGFELPCIADIKIGRVTYGPDATPEKIEKHESKFPPQRDIGYRILAMRIYEEGKFKMYGDNYCLRLTKDTIGKGIKKFTNSNPNCVELMFDQLKTIDKWFMNQRRFVFYGSSILFIYEAKKEHATVKLIDFAHVHEMDQENGKLDDNYIYGLKNLIKDFEACQPNYDIKLAR
ncbi:inositol polyphosphate multikinase-like [Varroa jacobsoni]|uniref:Kinase n=1 Tax=Varroa destructor TaxID=109461 RepID=A0A7M7JN30_VARDE|nr:inositol polyphosphate multikinase-like [Varroa destructor]XP_022697824.1 inositol polyphosphate multikinase-like [Varroa jacobsoni]